jgi:hypothetical protein
MRNALRLLALVLVTGALVVWLGSGANCAWTKTSVPLKTLDSVSGIEGIKYERRFVPGVDFLGAAALGAAVLAGASWCFRPRPQETKNQP